MDVKELKGKLVPKCECKNVLIDMKESNLPLIIWGGGSMAYSVRKLLRSEGIKIDACWIDNCKENEYIDGIPVFNLESISEKYDVFNVICGHSRYELVDEIKKRNKNIDRFFCLVNVCYGQWKGIEYDFVLQHAKEYADTMNLLDDSLSRECALAYLNCKLSEDYAYLVPCCREVATYFNNPFYNISDNEDYVDVGAYNGDTLKMFLGSVRQYKHIYAFEPEEQSYQELCDYINCNGVTDAFTYQCGCWNEDTELYFADNQESSCVISDANMGGTRLTVRRLDTLLSGARVTLIKINFMNGVVETLEGAGRILAEQKPKLAITVGFDEWGLIKIPQTIKQINPEYRLYLRYAAAMPARLILFAC